MSAVTPEFEKTVQRIIDQYRPVLQALAANDAGATDEEIAEILATPTDPYEET